MGKRVKPCRRGRNLKKYISGVLIAMKQEASVAAVTSAIIEKKVPPPSFCVCTNKCKTSVLYIRLLQSIVVIKSCPEVSVYQLSLFCFHNSNGEVSLLRGQLRRLLCPVISILGLRNAGYDFNTLTSSCNKEKYIFPPLQQKQNITCCGSKDKLKLKNSLLQC